MEEKTLWERCVAFHGHECGGLTIGFKAALYAKKLLGLGYSEDEEIACVSENDACGVDAIQVVLGCTAGKGNLYFHLTGKQAFTFYDRGSGKSARLVLRPKPENLTREQSAGYYANTAPEELFDVKEPKRPLPGEAQIFGSCVCEECGESTAERWIRIKNGKKVCLDCWGSYDRFHL